MKRGTVLQRLSDGRLFVVSVEEEDGAITVRPFVPDGKIVRIPIGHVPLCWRELPELGGLAEPPPVEPPAVATADLATAKAQAWDALHREKSIGEEYDDDDDDARMVSAMDAQLERTLVALGLKEPPPPPPPPPTPAELRARELERLKLPPDATDEQLAEAHAKEPPIEDRIAAFGDFLMNRPL